MKKIMNFVSFLLISLLFSSNIYADELIEWSNTWVVNITTTSLETTTSTWSVDEKTETSYVYYYWQGCWYCANVDKYMTKVNWWDSLNIVKKEVWSNDENRESMMSDAQRLGIDTSDIWVPFLVINEWGEESYLIWDKPVIEHFTPILWEAPKNNNIAIILSILAVLAVILPVFLIKLSSKN